MKYPVREHSTKGQVMSSDIDTDDLSQRMKIDWTEGAAGRSNSSKAFQTLSDEVGSIIKDSAHDLIAGNTKAVGRVIMAQLAHVHGLAPAPVVVQEASVNEWRKLTGTFEWNGQMYFFHAEPTGISLN